MRLILLRHAPAEDGYPDADRPLTPEGRRIAERLARFCAGRPAFAVPEIWCSPHLRARQTAAPFAGSGAGAPVIRFMPDLVPEGDPAALLPRLREREEPLLIVGHNPHLSRLAARLLGLGPAAAPLAFKKGALFVFSRDSGSATGFSLAGYLTPALLGLKD